MWRTLFSFWCFVCTPLVMAEETFNVEQEYLWRCSFCHDTGYGGAPSRGKYFDWIDRLYFGVDVLVLRSQLGYKRMPAKGGSFDLTDEEYQQLAYFLLSSLREID